MNITNRHKKQLPQIKNNTKNIICTFLRRPTKKPTHFSNDIQHCYVVYLEKKNSEKLPDLGLLIIYTRKKYENQQPL